MPCFRLLVTDLSWQLPELHPGLVCVNKVALRQFFPSSTSSFPVVIILLFTFSVICHQRYIILAIDSILKESTKNKNNGVKVRLKCEPAKSARTNILLMRWPLDWFLIGQYPMSNEFEDCFRISIRGSKTEVILIERNASSAGVLWCSFIWLKTKQILPKKACKLH